MFCGFTLGSAFGGVVSAQLVPLIGWHGILVLGGVLPLLLAVALLFALPNLRAGRSVASCRRRDCQKR
jgi:AAHS family 4-hydroxybenzoate transporter-like MFS transporter